MEIMAEIVGREIQRGQTLRLGSLLQHEKCLCTALFLLECSRNWDPRTLIFTSWSSSDGVLNKYTSYEVELVGMPNQRVELHVKSWVNGLWFAAGEGPVDVIFPWCF